VSQDLSSFLDAYDVHRVGDQQHFYEERVREYDRSASQTSWVSEMLLFVAAVCGIAAATWSDQALWLGVTAAGLAAIAGAIGSWAEVVGFSANAGMYRAALSGLGIIRPSRPDPSTASPEEVAAYRNDVEEILLGEVRTWSQRWGKPPAQG
jgi:hypothetical protein